MIRARIVYCVTRDLDAASVLADMECLSAEERTRAVQFGFDQDRRDFVVAHALLRRTLTTLVPRDPTAWSFINSPSGKPGLANTDLEGGSIAFNLSHTRGLVACVVARGAEVGIDVERVPGYHSLDVARARFSMAEVRDLESRPAAEQRERFTELWTLKEAHAKATGAGIVSGDDQPSFTFAPSGSMEVVPAATDERAWTFALFGVLDYRLAVAVRADSAVTISIGPSANDVLHGADEARLLRKSPGAVVASYRGRA